MKERKRTEVIHGQWGRGTAITFKSQSGNVVQRELIFVIYKFQILLILLLNVSSLFFSWIKLLCFFFFFSCLRLRQHLYFTSLSFIPTKLRNIDSFLPIEKTVTKFYCLNSCISLTRLKKTFLIPCT